MASKFENSQFCIHAVIPNVDQPKLEYNLFAILTRDLTIHIKPDTTKNVNVPLHPCVKTMCYTVPLCSRFVMGLRQWLRDISLPVYLMVLVFNMSAWVDMIAMLAELPLFVNRLPEGWDLGFYCAITFNVSKIGVVVYVVLKKVFGDKVNDVCAIYVVIGVGYVSLVLLAFLWDRTVWIAGQERSFVLLALSACLGTVDNMSVVVFAPYMARFKSQYLTAFFLGEGISGVLPAVLGVLQGVGEKPDCVNITEVVFNQTTNETLTYWKFLPVFPDPRFSIRTFFLLISVIMFLSGVSFSLIHFLPYSKRAHSEAHPATSGSKQNEEDEESASSSLIHLGTVKRDDGEKSPLGNADTVPDELPPCNGDIDVAERDEQSTLSGLQFFYLLFLVFIYIFLQYGISPGLHPYAALPFGDRAYNLGVRLSLIMNPVGALLTLLVVVRSLKGLGLFTLAATLLGAYEVYLACASPDPPLKGTVIGEVIVVSTFINYR